MPFSRFDWLARIKAVEREYNATRYATDYLLNAVRESPDSLRRDIRARDINEASKNLEGTYIIRVFAEFETCLRVFWDGTYGRHPPSRTKDLLDGVGARRTIPYDRIDNAHVVREFRNGLIHERDDEVQPISIDAARSHLCHYLSFLPIQW